MIDNASPAMSVVIVVQHRFESVRQTIQHLAAQDVRDQLEIVIVAPSARELQPDEQELGAFHSWRVVEARRSCSVSEARAAGIWGATAPIVVLAEDHSYPQLGWARALLEAHRGPWAAVGPAMCNANPASSVSWANFLVEYGQWMCPAKSGERDHLPGHNSAYKREVLLDYGERLPAMLDAESVLHWDLRARGYRLYLEPAARTHHLNPSRLLAWLPNRLRCGRAFAGPRGRNWPWWRRLVYAAGALLQPVRGGLHCLQRIRDAGLTGQLVPRVLPPLFLILVMDGLGRSAGYALGHDDQLLDANSLDFGRHRFLNDIDRQVEARRQPAGAR